MNIPDVPGWLRTRLMVALVLTAALAFGVRFNDLMSQSHAQDAGMPPLGALEPAAGEETPPPPAASAAAPTPAPAAEAPAAAKPAIETPKADWKDSSDSDIDYSPVQMQLFEDLSKRRAELDARDKDLRTREALLQAAEKNLEQKYKELSDLRSEVQDLLKQQNEEETARIASLVKIYEGMKAKDAARIFDTLDMDVLLEVMGKMSERKSAPILAAMNPERARSVTIMLAEQKALPTLDEELAVQ